MPIPPISELEFAARKLVWNARKRGNLKEYTPRLVRSTLEDQFHLDEGSLDAAEYKSSIKAATKAAVREDPPAEEEEKSLRVERQPQPPSASKRKRKLDGTIKGDGEKIKSASSSKGKGKAKMAHKVDDEKDDEGSAKKRRTTVSKKKKVVSDDDASSLGSKRRQVQTEKPFKSMEYVPTSDMEQDEPNPQPTLKDENRPSSSRRISNGTVSPKKDTTPKKSKDKPEGNGDSPVNDPGAKSESELSVLIDEPPKKSRKSKSKSESKEPKKTRVKKEAPTLSKDEERVKRLKSFIVACGVRKVWSKLFQGLETPRQQIKVLEGILADLGMHGRMTMDQAKAIKQKRELAQELEDVQAFAKAVDAKDPEVRTRKGVKALRRIDSSGSEDEKGESSDDGEESDVGPKTRPTNARKSITAFLQDQSD